MDSLKFDITEPNRWTTILKNSFESGDRAPRRSNSLHNRFNNAG